MTVILSVTLLQLTDLWDTESEKEGYVSWYRQTVRVWTKKWEKGLVFSRNAVDITFRANDLVGQLGHFHSTHWKMVWDPTRNCLFSPVQQMGPRPNQPSGWGKLNKSYAIGCLEQLPSNTINLHPRCHSPDRRASWPQTRHYLSCVNLETSEARGGVRSVLRPALYIIFDIRQLCFLLIISWLNDHVGRLKACTTPPAYITIRLTTLLLFFIKKTYINL